MTEICCRLDGLPLAIELAAAWVRSIPLAELATQLHGRFHLLTSGNRTALPRHQTLRAVFAWSWDLLTDDERNLAQRLAVFPGTVTPQSAEAVYTPISADSPSTFLKPLKDWQLIPRWYSRSGSSVRGITRVRLFIQRGLVFPMGKVSPPPQIE